MRVISWFSCGIASAVATKLTLEKHPDTIIAYCDTASEHEDNGRFLKECQEWFDKEILILKSKRYTDIWDVFKKTRWLVGVDGARCTSELKKMVRRDFEEIDDLQVFGYTIEEEDRVAGFREENPEVNLHVPLVDLSMTKHDCFDYFENSGIRRPVMYQLGFNNNNCIGCVKGGQGYWNHIRKHFPDVFDKMAKVERELNASINKTYAGDGVRKRLFLDELPPDVGRHKAMYEEDLFSHKMSCDFLCSSEGEND